MLQKITTVTGLLALAKRPDDGEIIFELSGTYTGLSFTVKGSVDGVGFSNKACIDDSTGLLIAGGVAIAPADGSTVAYRLPAGGMGSVGLNITAISGGSLTVSYQSMGNGAGGIADVLSTAASVVAPLPPSKFTTLNATTGSLPVGAITGAQDNFLLSTNAVPGAQLVRTAAQMLADSGAGISVGQSITMRIVNSGAGTLTLTTDAGATVTMTGTMTVPTNTFRDFVLTFNTPTTATVQSVGSGTI